MDKFIDFVYESGVEYRKNWCIEFTGYDTEDYEDELGLVTNCQYGRDSLADLLGILDREFIKCDELKPNKAYMGFMFNGIEEHYFLILTTNHSAYLFNSYGGVLNYKIILKSIIEMNQLIHKLKQGEHFFY
jgi:hypothetical protein